MAGTWQALANQPKFNTSTIIMLTDGRVMVQEEAMPHWHALTPDATGSYINGTWSSLADMSFWRRYYASGVLKDGRVIHSPLHPPLKPDGEGHMEHRTGHSQSRRTDAGFQ